MRQTTAVAIMLFTLLTACGGGGGGTPSGWKLIAKDAGGTTYQDPSNAQRTLTVSNPVPYGGTIKDLSTKLTIDTVLHEPGSKMLQATMFPPCPGEAGLLIFERAKPAERIEIAFTQWSGKAVSATYRGPAGQKPGKTVIRRMRSAVCSG